MDKLQEVKEQAKELRKSAAFAQKVASVALSVTVAIGLNVPEILSQQNIVTKASLIFFLSTGSLITFGTALDSISDNQKATALETVILQHEIETGVSLNNLEEATQAQQFNEQPAPPIA